MVLLSRTGRAMQPKTGIVCNKVQVNAPNLSYSHATSMRHDGCPWTRTSYGWAPS